MGNTEQFSDEYRRGFEDALKGAIIVTGFCSDIGGSTAWAVKTVLDRIKDVTPENYSGWVEHEANEGRSISLVEVPVGGSEDFQGN